MININFANSSGETLVASNIFDIVWHDGQRGVPSEENCLLLLNVVASKPLTFAKPENDKPCNRANFSIALHNILCSISPSFGVFIGL